MPKLIFVDLPVSGLERSKREPMRMDAAAAERGAGELEAAGATAGRH